MSVSARLPFDAARLRADFPILEQRLFVDVNRNDQGVPLVYLDNGATTQHPRQVLQAIVDCYERTYSNVHRGAHYLSGLSTDAVNAAREKVQRFINAPRFEEVIFTRGTTESINLVARSWGDAFCKPGDEIVVTEIEHHANLVPWQQLAARAGVKLRHLPVRDDGELDMAALPGLLNERTRLVAFTAVSNVLGTITPVSEVTAAAKRVGALTLVDAAQSAPHLRTDVQAWGADFIAFSSHKMLGPTGVGVLWGRYDLLDAMPPFLGGGGMIDRVWPDRFTPGDLPYRFEAGTPAIAEIIGLGAAVDYLEQVGLDAVHAHEQLLTARAHDVLGALPGVKIWGPPPARKAGLVSFSVDGIHPNDVASVLDRRGIAVRAGHHCAMPLHDRLKIPASTRASFYLYNTLDEIDRLGEGIAHAQKVLRRRSS
jgi:cysteine desulfurase/selenocysteine lyase